MEPRKVLGIRAYARHRGVSHTAVRKAIETGRIAGALVRPAGSPAGKSTTLDVEAADRLWDANTDGAQQRSAAAPPPSVPSIEPGKDLFGQPIAPKEDEKPKDDSAPRPGTFAAARVDREVWAGRIAEQKYRQVSGELVSLTRARDLFFQLSRVARDAGLAVAARVAHDFAAETNPDRIERRLRKELELAFASLDARDLNL